MDDSRKLYGKLAAHFDRTNQLEKGGTKLDYLDIEQVVSRLSDVLGMDGWAFEVREHGRDGETLWTLGRLTAYLPERVIVREQFGECQTTRGMQAGDARKGATSDALKKCASLIGVGLYLSDKEEKAAAQHAARSSASPGRAAQAVSGPPTPAAPSAEQSGARASGGTPVRRSGGFSHTQRNHGNCTDCGANPCICGPVPRDTTTWRPVQPSAEAPASGPLSPDQAAAWARTGDAPQAPETAPAAANGPHGPTGELVAVTKFYARCERELRLARADVLARLGTAGLKEAMLQRKIPCQTIPSLEQGLPRLYDVLAQMVADERERPALHVVEAEEARA